MHHYNAVRQYRWKVLHLGNEQARPGAGPLPRLALPPESLQGAALIFLRMEGVAHDLRPELWEALADGNWISFHSAPQLLLCAPERRLC